MNPEQRMTPAENGAAIFDIFLTAMSRTDMYDDQAIGRLNDLVVAAINDGRTTDRDKALLNAFLDYIDTRED